MNATKTVKWLSKKDFVVKAVSYCQTVKIEQHTEALVEMYSFKEGDLTIQIKGFGRFAVVKVRL